MIHDTCDKEQQAGAELSHAQLKLGLGFTTINLYQIDEQEMLHAGFTTINN